MRKNIYTILATLAIILSVTASQAQITVTYKVDITDYLAGGATLNANGIRVGGNFTDLAATNSGGSAVPNWTPAAAESAMTDEGNNIWSISVTYPTASIGMVQQYKFVNGDWGTNEGTDAGNTIGADGCGSDDGAGNVNRLLTIPDANVGYQFCWDHCFKCDGSSPLLSGVQEIPSASVSVEVTPNLVTNSAQINYDLVKGGNVNVLVRSFAGNIVANLENKVQTPGSYSLDLVTDNLSNGIYLVQISVNGAATTKRFVVNH